MAEALILPAYINTAVTSAQTMAGPLALPAGTAAAPGLTFGGDQTGLYRVSAGVLGVALAGAAAYSAAILGNNVQLMNRVTNNANAGFLFYAGSGALAGSIDASSGMVVRAGGVAASPSGNNGSSGTIRYDGTASSNGAVARLEATNNLSGALSGATVDLAGAIPAGAVVKGVVARVNTAITGGGVTSWQLGTAADPDMFGDTLALGTGAVANSWTITSAPYFAATTAIRLTATGGTFSGGVVRVIVYYEVFGAPTS